MIPASAGSRNTPEKMDNRESYFHELRASE
jgi:hypothetical protein